MADQKDDGTWEWQGVAPSNIEDPNFWEFMIAKFGQFGTPGYTEEFSEAKGFSNFFGHDDPVPIRWTLYRSESTEDGVRGELIAIHSLYDVEGGHKPFIFIVNPKYQRQGYGSKMADFILRRSEQEYGRKLDGGEQFGNAEFNPSLASFVNKYVSNQYAKRNTENQ